MAVPLKPAQVFTTVGGSKMHGADKSEKQKPPVVNLLQDDAVLCCLRTKTQTDLIADVLQVSSTGQLSIVPNICQFTIVVSSRKERLQDVKNSVSRRVNYVLQTLHNKHVKESEIHVTEVLRRIITDVPVEQFGLDSEVAVSTHDASLYQPVSNIIVEKLDKHVTVSPPLFSHDQATLENARRQAALLAAKNCRQKANELAQLVGAKLGAAVSVKEDECQEWHEPMNGVTDMSSLGDIPSVQKRITEATVHIAAKVTIAFELHSLQRRKERKL